MPGAEISNVKSEWVNGALRFKTAPNGEDLFTVGCTTGVPFGFQGQSTLNITAATTLVASTHGGLLLYCTTDDIVFTLPTVTATTVGYHFTIMNTASDGGAKLVLRTNATTDYIVGYGNGATTNCAMTNTKDTANKGDKVSVQSSILLIWYVVDAVGTWAFSATS